MQDSGAEGAAAPSGAALSDEDRGRLRTRLCGLPLATPLVMLSGCVGFGEELSLIHI